MPIKRFIWTTHAEDKRYPGGTMTSHAHYDPEVDIAMISFEHGRANSERYDWGLIDRNPDDGHLMGFVIWEVSTVLPAEMIAALPTSGKPTASAA